MQYSNLATKLKAFHGRGKSDYRTSYDLEHIITVIDRRRSSPDEVRLAPLDLQKYLSNEFEALLSNRDFIDALPGSRTFDTASQQRAGLILERMKRLIFEG
jgi:hypothetical protein